MARTMRIPASVERQYVLRERVSRNDMFDLLIVFGDTFAKIVKRSIIVAFRS